MGDRKLIAGGLYRHFKGGLYILRGIAEHSENGKAYVIYEDAETRKLWVRPYGIFVSKVDTKKYPEATQEYRFELVPDGWEPEDDEVCEDCAITYSWEREVQE